MDIWYNNPNNRVFFASNDPTALAARGRENVATVAGPFVAASVAAPFTIINPPTAINVAKKVFTTGAIGYGAYNTAEKFSESAAARAVRTGMATEEQYLKTRERLVSLSQPRPPSPVPAAQASIHELGKYDSSKLSGKIGAIEDAINVIPNTMTGLELAKIRDPQAQWHWRSFGAALAEGAFGIAGREADRFLSRFGIQVKPLVDAVAAYGGGMVGSYLTENLGMSAEEARNTLLIVDSLYPDYAKRATMQPQKQMQKSNITPVKR